MHTCASYGLLLLSSKFNLFACSLKMDLGPLTMFSLVTCVILNLVSREHWRNTAGRDRFASLFSYFCSSHSWAHTFSPDIFSASGNCSAGGASSPAPAVHCSLSVQPLQKRWLSQRQTADMLTDSPVRSLYHLLQHLPRGSAPGYLLWDPFLWMTFPGLLEGEFPENFASNFSST